MNHSFWLGKKVFITGHTGFKGGWLALWLLNMGAKVYGYSLIPPTKSNFFTVTGLTTKLSKNTFGDIRDTSNLTKAMQLSDADIVFHLAAQPLVRYSYVEPVETYSTNVMGTINVLEAVRKTSSVRAVVNVTTDKCYENREWIWPYREHEALGGYDPYSSSKACAELVASAYRNSFLREQNVHVASTRAGNVIGGGDWADDRLIPDFLRAIDLEKTLLVRSPQAIRPWQHVLEPLAGYLNLGEKLIVEGSCFAEPWNFGPNDEDAKSVEWILNQLCKKSPKAQWRLDKEQQLHEAHTLRLDSSKAKARLDWSPRWNLEKALTETFKWHTAWKKGEDMALKSLEQINSYEAS